MIFRKATLKDLPFAMRIISDAVGRMSAEGKCQWSENYPREQHIITDILDEVGYVLEDNGIVVAYGAVVFSGEPAYEHLEGEWLTDGDYVVLHRLAVDSRYQSMGIGRRYMSAVEHLAAVKGVGSFRIDTNFDNERMLALVDRCGFEFTGTIRYADGERRAFEKLI